MATISKRRGRYVLDYYDHQGIRQRKTLKKGVALKQAKEKLRDIEDRLSKGIYIPENKIPKFSKVAEDWLNHKKISLRDSTWSVYKGHTENHLCEFNDLKVDRITVSMIEKWISERLAENMPIATIRKILVSMGQIFKYAARHKYISYNPFLDAERPRIDQVENETESGCMRILSPAKINALIAATKTQKYRTLIRLAVMSGARQGELLGLKWSDIDWDNNQIHIQRTYNNQAWYPTKTKKSNRKVDIGPLAMSELRKWKVACPPNKLDLVFPNEHGQPINHNNMVNRYFNPALLEAGIGKLRFHDLRHTFCSHLWEKTKDIVYVSNQLGHSSPNVTLKIYTHVIKPVNQEAALSLEEAIFEPVTIQSQPSKN